MNKKLKVILVSATLLVALFIIALGIWYISTHNIAVLNPKGMIAEEQRQLMITASLLMAIVVLPVFALTFGIAWRYRANNKKATYSPELSGSKLAETVWWLIPLAIIILLAGIAVTSSHSLDPYRAISSDKKPLQVQVIALQWKWLFIYPEQHVASVNYLPLPINTPIEFTITSDAPMNSLWIPQLGGQVYAMSGMSTKLHLQASHVGDYQGSSANISGEGFAGMKFTAHAAAQSEFDAWVASAQRSAHILDLNAYNDLSKPSKDVRPTAYSFPPAYAGLYDTVVMKYMTPHKSEGN